MITGKIVGFNSTDSTDRSSSLGVFGLSECEDKHILQIPGLQVFFHKNFRHMPKGFHVRPNVFFRDYQCGLFRCRF